MSLTEVTYENAEQLNEKFAERIVELLQSEVNVNGTATLVVSGGRTPVGLFNSLSTKGIDWSSITVTLADERWVDEQDDASNAKLVKTHLLINNAKDATFLSLKTSHSDAYDAESEVAELLSSVARPFTVTILGMGEDGHTASLFPCSAEVERGLDLNNDSLCLAATPTTAPHQRMSLTLKQIVASKNVFLHLTGEKKKKVLHKAIADTQNPKPIVSVVDNADVTLCWAP